MDLDELLGLEVYQLKEWLAIAYSLDDFSPMLLNPEPSLAVQLRHYVQRLGIPFAERLKAAIAICISEWQIHQGPDYLKFLLELISQLRVTAAVSSVYLLLKNRRIEGMLSSTNVPIAGLAMGVIAGFAEAPGVIQKLDALVASDDVPEYLRPQAILGICRVSPERIVDLLPKLVDSLDLNNGRPVPSLVISCVLDQTSPSTLEAAIGRLDEWRERKLLRLLKIDDGRLFYLGWDRSSNASYLIYRNKYFHLGRLGSRENLKLLYKQMRGEGVTLSQLVDLIYLPG
jgi:hypothetical protein